jgi:hypothetical protein
MELFSLKLNKNELKYAYNNPHCIEYFATNKKIIDCSECKKILMKNNIYKSIEFKEYQQENSENNLEKCKKKCTHNSYLYSLEPIHNRYSTNFIDKIKEKESFKKNKLYYKLDDIPYKLDYELTTPKPKTVIHYGQLKMLLITLIFLIKVIKKEDNIVHIVYIGSAAGHNILILCDMFPNTRWYLVDPNKFNPLLFKHKQVIEIKNEYFTDILAQYYKDKLKKEQKFLFISDIRVGAQLEDTDIIRDQEMNKKWIEIMEPDYSYLKFRTPYKDASYKYMDGTIYIQPFAPVSSTETRLLVTKNWKEKVYNSKEYNGKLFYHNRIMRPGYYPSLISNHKYLDHCFDCTYFTYLIKNYIDNFDNISKKENKNDKIKYMCDNILHKLEKYNKDKLKIKTIEIKNNMKFNQ